MGKTKINSRPYNIDFASKVRWRMKYDRNPLLSIFQDKYSVKKFANSKGIKTPKLIFATDNPGSITFKNLPADCFIKANHGCEWNILRIKSKLYLFKDGSDFEDLANPFFDTDKIEKYRISEEESFDLCTQWLQTKYQSEEWAYQNIEPRILIEEIQFPEYGKDLLDYRLYTFNGKVKAISIGSLNYRRTKKNVFFDPDWNEIELSIYKEDVPVPLPDKPENLDSMISIAETLGENVDFVRIDLFNTNKGIALSEMTVYPEGGAQCTPTLCPTFNRWLGSHWELSFSPTIQAFLFNFFYSTSIKFFGRYKDWRVNPTKTEILKNLKVQSKKGRNLVISEELYS